MKRKGVLPVIGWREWVSLPDLGIEEIKAKIDTGARSSALHAFEIEPFRRRGRSMVRFVVHPYQLDGSTAVVSEAELLGMRRIRNSGGQEEVRPVIRTTLEVLGERWPIELTLTNRDTMGFRMLLGRQAVRHRFLVDPGCSHLQGRFQQARRPGPPAPSRGRRGP